MVTEQVARRLLAQTGAVVTGDHFVYTSGMHGDSYVNKDAVYPHTAVISALCEGIATQFADAPIHTVIAPAMGGIILSQWVAYHLTQKTGREVFGVYAEKNSPGDTFSIRRGYDQFVKRQQVLVVEDILTTGGSVKKVIEAVHVLEGEVVAVAAICNRGKVTSLEVGGPLVTALVNFDLSAWPESDCPLCAQRVPVNTQLGKGAEFLAKKRSTPLSTT